MTEVSWADGPRARRGAYGDKLHAELEFPGKECTLADRAAGDLQPAAAGSGEVSGAGGRGGPRRRGARPSTSRSGRSPVGDVDITKAEFLLSIGRGHRGQGQHPPLRALGRDRLGATLSVSRPLVDAGWMSNARQVGQSGKTVKPRVYLALGISGAVQHLAGMRTADTIIAVNTDPEAPIFGVAHYGAVADLFDVADELERALD